MSIQRTLAYMRLFRWPNLLIVALTQVLLRFGVLLPMMPESALAHVDFFVLVITSVFVAAAGYAINDHYDQDIDRVNKPGANLVGSVLGEREVLLVYVLLNILALTGAVYLALHLGWELLFLFALSLFFSWWYSAHGKALPFLGNLLVAGMSACVPLLVWLAETGANDFLFYGFLSGKMAFVVMGYALFSGLSNLLRELLKDMEDLKGDLAGGCRTLPVLLGMRKSAGLAASLAILLVLVIGLAQFLLFTSGMKGLAVYFFPAAQVPLLYIVFLLRRDPAKHTVTRSQKLLKLVMLAGVLSMLWFLFYNV